MNDSATVGPAPKGGDFEDQSATLLTVVVTILRHRRLVLLCMLIGVAVSSALILPRARRFTVETTFVPQAKRTNGALAGFAAQLGVSVPGAEGIEQSSPFYVDLVQTRAILGAVVDSPHVNGRRGVIRLADVLDANESDSLRRRDATIDRLRRTLTVSFSQRTGVVRVRATLPSPVLAKDVVEQLLREVIRFNLSSRQTQAAAERRFTEQRLAEARAELQAAEGRTQDFLVRNREYRNAPQLVFEYERLNREVALRQQLYNSLAQAYDQAKIDEVRDTPLITVIEQPDTPSRPDARGLVRWGVVAGLVGLVIGCALALIQDYLAANERNSDTIAEFRDLRRQAVADLRRPWRIARKSR